MSFYPPSSWNGSSSDADLLYASLTATAEEKAIIDQILIRRDQERERERERIKEISELLKSLESSATYESAKSMLMCSYGVTSHHEEGFKSIW